MAASGDAPPYRALALDLDGTLLDEQGQLGDLSAQAVIRIAASGIRVVLMSGRMQPAVESFWQQLRLDTPIVSYNGARIATPGTPPLHDVWVMPDLASDIVRFCEQHDLHLNAYCDERLYVFRDNQMARWYAEYFRVPLHFLDPAADWPGKPPTKLLVITDPAQLESAYTRLQAAFGASVQLTTSSGQFVEILPPATSKGAALLQLAERWNLPAQSWIAVGDGRNDLEMIQTAGLGLAVENGSDVVKEAAKGILPPLPKGGLHVLTQDILGLPICV